MSSGNDLCHPPYEKPPLSKAVLLGSASPDDASARAKEQLDKAADEDLAALGTIADAVMVAARGQRRDL